MTIYDNVIFSLDFVGKLFINRNANVVPLHRQNTAPTCGRKNSHVWPQKTPLSSRLSVSA